MALRRPARRVAGYFAALDPEKQPKVWTEGSLRKQRLFLAAERNLIEQLLFAGLIPEVAKESRKTTLECDPRLGRADGRELSGGGCGGAERSDPGASAGTQFPAREHARQSGRPAAGRAEPVPGAAEASRDGGSGQGAGAAPGISGIGQRAKADRPVLAHAKSSPQWPATLDVWLPLMDRPDVMVVALHPASAEAELADFAQRTGRDLIFDRRVDFSGDLGEYAAQVQACDFVIAVEDLTSVLAGVMGKPTIKLKRPVDHWWWGMTGRREPLVRRVADGDGATGPSEAEVAQVAWPVGSNCAQS